MTAAARLDAVAALVDAVTAACARLRDAPAALFGAELSASEALHLARRAAALDPPGSKSVAWAVDCAEAAADAFALALACATDGDPGKARAHADEAATLRKQAKRALAGAVLDAVDRLPAVPGPLRDALRDLL